MASIHSLLSKSAKGQQPQMCAPSGHDPFAAWLRAARVELPTVPFSWDLPIPMDGALSGVVCKEFALENVASSRHNTTMHLSVSGASTRCEGDWKVAHHLILEDPLSLALISSSNWNPCRSPFLNLMRITWKVTTRFPKSTHEGHVSFAVQELYLWPLPPPFLPSFLSSPAPPHPSPPSHCLHVSPIPYSEPLLTLPCAPGVCSLPSLIPHSPLPTHHAPSPSSLVEGNPNPDPDPNPNLNPDRILALMWG